MKEDIDKTKIVKKWKTKAGLYAVVQEGGETICHVGVVPKHQAGLKRRGDLELMFPEIKEFCRYGLSRAGMLSDPGLDDEERKLWWFSFTLGADARLADIERAAEDLARTLSS